MTEQETIAIHVETSGGGAKSLSLCEQEICITGIRTEGWLEIYASDSTYITKLDRLCRESPEYYECLSSTPFGKTYRLKDKSLLSFRKTKMKKEITEEQRKAYSERMAKVRRGQLRQKTDDV